MNLKLELPKLTDLKPRIVVIGVGGAGGNAVNNMITSGLDGVEFVVANTDAQSLVASNADRKIQLGITLTEGLGAGARPEIGERAAEEVLDEIRSQLTGAHMVFVAAGMGGGTGTGAAAVIARAARSLGILTVGVVTKPFLFEGQRRMRMAEAGIAALRPHVDTLIVIPNQNLFRIANERTTFADAFLLADQVLYSGIACIVDLIVKDGLINLDFADVRTIMQGMGAAMMGTGEASGERRATIAAEEAIANPLLDDVSLKGAKGLLLSIIGGRNLTLYEVDEAATRIRKEVDPDANIIVGATFDDALGDRIRVSIVAAGIAGASTAGGWQDPAPSRPYAPSPSPAAHLQMSPPPAPPITRAPQGVEPSPTWPAEHATARSVGDEGSGRIPVHGSSHQLPPAPPRQSASRLETSAEAAELTRALSEAIEQAAIEENKEASAPWRSPEGAVFEEAALQLDNAPAPYAPHGAALPIEDAQGYAPQFEPAAPMDVRHSGRRMLQVEDFPAVGQREYRAKMGIPEPPAEVEAAPPPRKPTFFERITGTRRRDSAPVAGTTQREVPRKGAESRAEAEPQRSSRDRPSGPASDRRRDDQGVELPVFFGHDRKS